MKKSLLLLVSLAILFAGCKNSDDIDPQIDDPTEDQTDDPTEEVEGIEFVSSEFESMILDSSRAHTPAKIDANGDGKITVEEAEAVTAIDVSGAVEVPVPTKETKSTELILSTLEDIEHFKNITTLNCSNNQLTELDLSQNSAITALNFSNNSIEEFELPLDAQPNLTSLDCSSNKFTAVDFAAYTSLNDINCSNNAIEAICVAANTIMTHFDCSYNELTELDLTSNKSLSYLDCSYNNFPVLSVESNSALTHFDCSNNELTELDLSSNDLLAYLDCSYNNFPTLDLSSNTSLTEVDCSNNKITALDVSELTNLAEGGLNCDNQTDAEGTTTTITVTTNGEQGDILADDTSEYVEVTTKDETDTTPEPEPDYDTYVTIKVIEPTDATDLPTSYQVVFNGATSTLSSGLSLALTFDYLRSGDYEAYVYNEVEGITMSSEYVVTATTTASLSEHLFFGHDTVSVVADSSTSTSIEVEQITRSFSIELDVEDFDEEEIASMEVSISGLAESWDCVEDEPSEDGDPYTITEELTDSTEEGDTTTFSGEIITYGTQGESQKITITITYDDGTKTILESDVSDKFTDFNSDEGDSITLTAELTPTSVGGAAITDWTKVDKTGESHTAK